jgi:hypothetical protein
MRSVPIAPPPLWLEVVAFTVTVAVCDGLVPSVPTQVNVKVVVAVNAADVAVPPLAATDPDQAPAGELDAVHELVFELDQVSATVPPELTLVGLTWSVAEAGAGACSTKIEYVPACAVAFGCATKLMR